MPKKILKNVITGKKYTLKSILLPNGNLVVTVIVSRDPLFVAWVEVAPGTSAFKRWYPAREIEPDPRQDPVYIDWVNTNVPQYAWTMTEVYEEPWKVKGDKHIFRNVLEDGKEEIHSVRAHERGGKVKKPWDK